MLDGLRVSRDDREQNIEGSKMNVQIGFDRSGALQFGDPVTSGLFSASS
jgi:hypothetical protein